MADYTPVFVPGTAVTLQASAAITGGQVVSVTGVSTVGPAPAASAKAIGVAAHDAASGAKVTVHIGKLVHESTAQGAVTAGDLLQVGTVAGSVATAGATPAAGVIIGTALTSAADTAAVRWVSRI